MAGKTSKTARASSPRMGASTGMSVSAEVPRLVSLAGGTHCYVRTAQGKNIHLATSSDAFVELLASEREAGLADRIDAELAELAAGNENWNAALGRLTSHLTAAAAQAEPSE